MHAGARAVYCHIRQFLLALSHIWHGHPHVIQNACAWRRKCERLGSAEAKPFLCRENWRGTGKRNRERNGITKVEIRPRAIRREQESETEPRSSHHHQQGTVVDDCVRGSMFSNFRHSTWPSSIPMLSPRGRPFLMWEVRCATGLLPMMLMNE